MQCPAVCACGKRVLGERVMAPPLSRLGARMSHSDNHSVKTIAKELPFSNTMRRIEVRGLGEGYATLCTVRAHILDRLLRKGVILIGMLS